MDIRSGKVPPFVVDQSNYQDEIARICARLEGPVCQIGAHARSLDAREANWRQRLRDKSFIGADLEPGDNVDAVFDVCDDLARIRGALAPVLPGGRLNGLVCVHLLEHLRRPWVAAENLQELLAPGGLIFLQVPWVQAFHAYPDDYWRMSLSGLLALFDEMEPLDVFYSGGSSDVAYRVRRDGELDISIEACQIEAQLFQVLLTPEDNKQLLAGLPERRLYLSRGYMPATVVNLLARKPHDSSPD